MDSSTDLVKDSIDFVAKVSFTMVKFAHRTGIWKVGEKFNVFVIGSLMTEGSAGSASSFCSIILVILLTLLKTLAGLL